MTRISSFFLVAAISFLAGQSSCFVINTGHLVNKAVGTLAPTPVIGGVVDDLLRSSEKTDSELNPMVIPGKPVTIEHNPTSTRTNRSVVRRQREMVIGILNNLSNSNAPITTESQAPSRPAPHKHSIPGISTASAVLSELHSPKTADVDAPSAEASSVVVPLGPASSPVAKPLPAIPSVGKQSNPDHPVDDSTVEANADVVDASTPVHVLPSFLPSNMPGVSTIPVKKTSLPAKASRAKRHVPLSMFSGNPGSRYIPLSTSIPVMPSLSSFPPIMGYPYIPMFPSIPSIPSIPPIASIPSNPSIPVMQSTRSIPDIPTTTPAISLPLPIESISPINKPNASRLAELVQAEAEDKEGPNAARVSQSATLAQSAVHQIKSRSVSPKVHAGPRSIHTLPSFMGSTPGLSTIPLLKHYPA